MPPGMRILVALTFAALLLAERGQAQAPTKVWESRAHALAPEGYVGANANYVRSLADGSFLVAGVHYNGTFAARCSPAGEILSQYSTTEREGPPFAVDDFGAVFAASPSAQWEHVDVIVTKRDGTTGAPLWPHTVVLDSLQHGDDRPQSLVVDPRGDVLVAALMDGFPSGSAILWKLDGRTGAVVWGPVEITGVSNGHPTLVRSDAEGNAYLAVTRSTSPGYIGKLSVTKLRSATGEVAWGPSEFGETMSDELLDAAMDGNGDVLVAGASSEKSLMLKLSGASGARLWGPISENGMGLPQSLVVDARGDATFAYRNSDYDRVALVHYDGRTGARLWGPILTPQGIWGALLAVRASGDIFMTFVEEDEPNTSAHHMATECLAEATGQILWGPVPYDTENPYDVPNALAVDASGTLILVGQSEADLAFAVRYDGASGTQLFPPRLFSGQVEGEVATQGALDSTGDLFVVSRSSTVTRFSTRTGRVVWGPVLFGERPAIVLEPTIQASQTGTIVVSRIDNSFKLMIAALDAATGAVLWTRSLDIGSGVFATDASGNVLVAGFAYGVPLTIQKLSGTSGATLWGPLNPAVSITRVGAAAVDSHGDLVIAGPHQLNSSSRAAKVSGANGALLWESPVIAASNTYEGWKVQFDALANPVVASSFAMTKLGGASGAVLWGPRPNGLVLDFVLTPSGDVLATGDATFRLAAASGAVTWSSPLAGKLVRLADTGDLYVAARHLDSSSATNFVLALSKVSGSTGSDVWSGPTIRAEADNPAALGVVGGDPVFVGTTLGAFPEIAAYRYTEGISLADATLAPDLAWCGLPYAFTFTAVNATPPVVFSIDAGTLPAGITLGDDGTLSGTPSTGGDFPFTVRLRDALGHTVTRDLAVRVLAVDGTVAINSRQEPACGGQDLVLEVSGAFDSYRWLPGGETTPTITVRPAERTSYLVEAMSGGCRARGSITVGPVMPPLAPTLAVSPSWALGGPGLVAYATARPGSSYLWTSDNGTISSGQGSAIAVLSPAFAGILHITLVETDAAGCAHPMASTQVQVVASPGGLLFYPVTPCRIFDTRDTQSPLRIGDYWGSRFWAVGTCGIPYTARALAANITAVNASTPGSLKVNTGYYAEIPPTDVLQFPIERARAGTGVIKLLPDDHNILFYAAGAAGTVHVIMDVSGYFE